MYEVDALFINALGCLLHDINADEAASSSFIRFNLILLRWADPSGRAV
jgi:hypothetical protein